MPPQNVLKTLELGQSFQKREVPDTNKLDHSLAPSLFSQQEFNHGYFAGS